MLGGMRAIQKANGNLLTIGQVARAAGVTTTSLRYYEREGMLIPSIRSAAGYRMYAPNVLEQLEFIRAAQGIGFTLDDIRALLELEQARKGRRKPEVQKLIRARLAEIEGKLKDLQRVRAALSTALDKCEHAPADCPLLSQLHKTSEASPALKS